MHVSAPGVVRGGRLRGPWAPFAARVPVVVVVRPVVPLPEVCPGRRSTGDRPPRPVRGGGLSKSATKARIEPERARRIVDIPRFSSRPIPARGAFVADLDTTPAPNHPRSPTSTITCPLIPHAAPTQASEPPVL